MAEEITALEALLSRKKQRPHGERDSLVSKSTSVSSIPEIEMTRITVRLESSLDLEIKNYCTVHRISREALIEAAMGLIMSSPESLVTILPLAVEKHRQRKTLGNKRKAQTMQKYNI